MKEKNTFCKAFRLIFAAFFLYLMGDAFFRWDGFSYYAPFSEFLPSIALVSVLWSMVAVLTTALIWTPFKVSEWVLGRAGWKIRIEHVIMFVFIAGGLGSILWIALRILWPDIYSPLVKNTGLLCVIFIALFMTWGARNKSGLWIDVVQERITPLVWLFGMIVIISVPLLSYHTWFKGGDKNIPEVETKTLAADDFRPNIILITFDALTSRDMSAYGYHRQTTPFISEWAKKATVFLRAKAESNLTIPTTTSLMTGKRPWAHGMYHSEGFNARGGKENLVLELKNKGYYTMIYSGNRFVTPDNLGIGNSCDNFSSIPSFTMSALSVKDVIDVTVFKLFAGKIPLYNWIIKEDFIFSKILNVVSLNFYKIYDSPRKAFVNFLKLIDGDIQKPFFAWFHFYPPHDWYLPPEPFMGMFNSSLDLRSEERQLIERKNVMRLESRSLSAAFFPDAAHTSVNLFRDRYDECVRYCDAEFKAFITLLERGNKLKNTFIMLSADHGESFEHGYFQHGKKHLFEQVTHIPLMISGPGQNKGTIIKDIVEQIDIPATILDLAGIPVPSWMDGRSLVPLMRGETLPQKAAFAMWLEENKTGVPINRGTIAVWEGDYKLIHYLNSGESILFNIKQDPDELDNLFYGKPEIAQHLISIIKNNLKNANERIMRENI